jgi:hypothetical protein
MTMKIFSINLWTVIVRNSKELENNVTEIVSISEQCRLLGCDAVWLLLEPTFRLSHQGRRNHRASNSS